MEVTKIENVIHETIFKEDGGVRHAQVLAQNGSFKECNYNLFGTPYDYNDWVFLKKVAYFIENKYAADGKEPFHPNTLKEMDTSNVE